MNVHPHRIEDHMTQNTTPEPEDGLLGGLVEKAQELGEKAKDLAGDAISNLKDFAGDLPGNARKITAETVAVVKDFAKDLPETAKNITEATVATVKNLVDRDAKQDPPAPTA